jgi:hypothetical protein
LRIRDAVAYLCFMRKSAFEPCIPTRGTKVPDRPEWLHEIKHDGYRLIVQRDGKRVRLFTHNGHDYVHGTLTEGFRIYQRLSEPLHRAIFMMFLVSQVHPFLDGNGRLARVMMNAELAAARQMRVLIPIVYRSNYISSLRALSANAWPEPIIKTLVFAQRYVASIPWNDLKSARSVLTRTNAFIRPEQGDEEGPP